MSAVSRPTVLVIEDELDILEVLRTNLTSEGYRVVCSVRGQDGLQTALLERPALVLLDLMLPDMDGLEVYAAIRQNEQLRNCAVIMLTSRSSERDTVHGLNMGVDDYVAKPFRLAELLARVRAVLARRQRDVTEDKAPITLGCVELNRSEHVLLVDGIRERLTAMEFKLLEVFMGSPTRVFSRRELIDAVQGKGMFVSERIIDTHCNGIRKKLGDFRACLETVWGVGYCFRPAAEMEIGA